MIIYIGWEFWLNSRKNYIYHYYREATGRKKNNLESYIISAALDLVGSQSIPRYARDALRPNKVLGILDNVTFPIIFLASPWPPYNGDVNN